MVGESGNVKTARLLPRLRVACLSDLLGHAGPLHYSRREPRRSRPIRAADGDVHGARSCLGPARSGRAEIRKDAADVKLGSGLVDQSQKLTAAAVEIAELAVGRRPACGRRSGDPPPAAQSRSASLPMGHQPQPMFVAHPSAKVLAGGAAGAGTMEEPKPRLPGGNRCVASGPQRSRGLRCSLRSGCSEIQDRRTLFRPKFDLAQEAEDLVMD